MAECGVCLENFEKAGAKCPKLLPCIHTFCLSCLKTLAEDGEIQCPYCRILHQISSEHIEHLPTNHGILKSRRNEISILPSSGMPPRIDGAIGICELHANPAIRITIVSEQNSMDQEEEESISSFVTVEGNYGSEELTNGIAVRNGPRELILLTSSLPPPSQPNHNCAVQNMEQVQSPRQQPNRIRLTFILSSPMFIIGCILIAVVAIPVLFVAGFGYILYTCARCKCCDGFIRGFKKFVGQFIKYLYDKYACFLALFGCIDEDDSWILRKLCWAAAEVVIFLVFAMNIFAFIGLLSLPLLLL